MLKVHKWMTISYAEQYLSINQIVEMKQWAILWLLYCLLATITIFYFLSISISLSLLNIGWNDEDCLRYTFIANICSCVIEIFSYYFPAPFNWTSKSYWYSAFSLIQDLKAF